jgi:hypothetical protein
VKRTHASRAVAVAAGAALALCGCGSSTKMVTTTTTASPATTTVTANPTSTNSGTSVNPAKGGYPHVFETSFMKSCVGAGGSHGACGCALAYIESHVPYATVLKQVASGTFESSSGYKLAVATCADR